MSEQVSTIHGNPARTIDSNGNSIDGDNQFRPFFVESGNVSICDRAITNATAKGGVGGLGGAGGGLGAGGAIFVNDAAQISLTNVHFQSNSAQGGNGGQGDTDPSPIRWRRWRKTGWSALNLDVGSIDTNSVRTLLGGRIQFSPSKTCQCKYITSEIRAIWMHELNDAVSTVNTQFAGLGSTGFGPDSLNVGHDWGVLGGGFAMQTLNGWQLRADYNAQFNDRQVLHAGSGTLSYSW